MSEDGPNGWSRRFFLRAGSLAGLSAGGFRTRPAEAARTAVPRPRASRVLFINLVGGPSHLETFDPKPDAPSEIRGPLSAIRTRVPGLVVSELFGGLAARADKLLFVRGVYHDAAPVHESGLQLLQTGRLAERDRQSPHFASVLDWAIPTGSAGSASVILPGTIHESGSRTSRGQTAGCLGPQWEPVFDFNAESPAGGRITDDDRRRYGTGDLATYLLAAREWLLKGARSVTVNTQTNIGRSPGWDAHARPPELPATLADYRQIAPALDQALSALLDDFEAWGMLADTLVVVAGEMGRTPKLNERGGRDHWSGCWTVLLAGAGVPGGVYGASDKTGTVPEDRPVHLSRLTATIYHALGVPADKTFERPGVETFRVYPAEPLSDIWG